MVWSCFRAPVDAVHNPAVTLVPMAKPRASCFSSRSAVPPTLISSSPPSAVGGADIIVALAERVPCPVDASGNPVEVVKKARVSCCCHTVTHARSPCGTLNLKIYKEAPCPDAAPQQESATQASSEASQKTPVDSDPSK